MIGKDFAFRITPLGRLERPEYPPGPGVVAAEPTNQVSFRGRWGNVWMDVSVRHMEPDGGEERVAFFEERQAAWLLLQAAKGITLFDGDERAVLSAGDRVRDELSFIAVFVVFPEQVGRMHEAAYIVRNRRVDNRSVDLLVNR